MTYLEFIGSLATGSGIVMAGIVFIIKGYTQNLFAYQLQKHAIDLQHQATIKEQEHKVRFTRFDEDRAIALKEVYQGTLKVSITLTQAIYAKNIEVLAELIDESQKGIGELTNSMFVNRILFDKEILLELDKLLMSLKDLAPRLLRLKISQHSQTPPQDIEQQIDAIHNELLEDFGNIVHELEAKFREILSI